MNEQSYIQGSQRAWLLMLQECLRQLGYDHPEAKAAAWVTERAGAVLLLRRVCEEHGDNDWSDDLHLVDVIEKHLVRYYVQAADSADLTALRAEVAALKEQRDAAILYEVGLEAKVRLLEAQLEAERAARAALVQRLHTGDARYLRGLVRNAPMSTSFVQVSADVLARVNAIINGLASLTPSPPQDV